MPVSTKKKDKAISSIFLFAGHSASFDVQHSREPNLQRAVDL